MSGPRFAKAILTGNAQLAEADLLAGEFGAIVSYNPRTRTAQQPGGWKIKIVDDERQIYGRWLRGLVIHREPSEKLIAYASGMVRGRNGAAYWIRGTR